METLVDCTDEDVQELLLLTGGGGGGGAAEVASL